MGRYILDINAAHRPSVAGLKASNLRYLKRAGFRVPKTLICPFGVYEDYALEQGPVLARLRLELEKEIRDDQTYSVRSSASVEDGQGFSFAGQFETFLDVSSVEGVLSAIQRVWDSSRNERAGEYMTRTGAYAGGHVKIGVVIQEMVHSEWAGVVFTKNPVDGMDEAIIEVVQGLGSLLNQEGTKPERWVNKWGRWISRPQDGDAHLAMVEAVLSGAMRIAAKYGRPVDLEWAYSNGDLYWLQLREITALKGVNIYSNRISKEFLPGQVKPLVWAVNVPLVNSAWKRLLVELLGKEAETIDVDSLAKAFHYRAYFNMGVLGDLFELLGMPRESIELLMGLERPVSGGPRMRPGAKALKYVPRILAFVVGKIFFDARIERFISVENQQRWSHLMAGTDSWGERETLDRVERLYDLNREGAYYVIVTQLLLGAYSFLYRRMADATESANEMVFRRRDEMSDVDPSHDLAILNQRYKALPESEKRNLTEGKVPDGSHSLELAEFREAFRDFLAKFGHLSDRSNDFSAVPWREQPDTAVKFLVSYQAPASRGEAEAVSSSSAKSIRGLLMSRLRRKVVRYAEYRERVNARYTYGYAQFRPAFLHLGRMLQGRDVIDLAEDIFFLSLEEIRRIVNSMETAENYKTRVAARKIEMENCKEVELPGIIVGDDPPQAVPKQTIAQEMTGTGTSRGYYQGRATIVLSHPDFSKVREGDVIVIPYSDASWTPLFAKAGAVVSESGGMLSHTSIVAREYGIPAVVSVTDACRIEDGTLVTVDGYGGLVIIHRRESTDLGLGARA